MGDHPVAHRCMHANAQVGHWDPVPRTSCMLNVCGCSLHVLLRVADAASHQLQTSCCRTMPAAVYRSFTSNTQGKASSLCSWRPKRGRHLTLVRTSVHIVVVPTLNPPTSQHVTKVTLLSIPPEAFPMMNQPQTIWQHSRHPNCC